MLNRWGFHRIRPHNHHAKAGNLNYALQYTDGELVAIFDCDHIPTRSFLKTTAGWFARDAKLAMLQTPHHFSRPTHLSAISVPSAPCPTGALFYGLLQDGSDFWNATFFCGSVPCCAASPLMEVGGIAVETVTEDAHTALKMQRRGYNTAYINEIQAAGLATESLSAHVGQRIRWARGMAQIFRTDNPFLGKGLACGSGCAMPTPCCIFFFGLPRLVFFDRADGLSVFRISHHQRQRRCVLALYVIPYILQANVANAHIQGKYRHSFWAEVYGNRLARYVALPTTVALINPKLGTFNVTAKGVGGQPVFRLDDFAPQRVSGRAQSGGAGHWVFRLFFWNSHEPATVAINLFLDGVQPAHSGCGTGCGSRVTPCAAHAPGGDQPARHALPGQWPVLKAECIDFSMTGVGLQLASDVQLAVGTGCRSA